MARTNEISKSTVILDGKQAEKELETLVKKGDELLDTMLKAKKAGDSIGYDNALKEFKKVEKAQADIKKGAIDVNKVLNNLNKATPNELRKSYNKLKKEIVDLDRTTDKYKKKASDLNKISKELDKVRAETRGVQKVTGGLVTSFKSLLPALGAGAIAAGLRSVYNNAKETRAEFAKYEAVLKVALGSQKEANKEFDKLKQFAAETPFQLNELTASYVKLTNYGLQPNMKEMQQYGDLASSVGKSFNDWVEAIADATTFETERLKEFGIRSQKEGDKIKFTFKGITTEVEKDAKAVQQYLAGLGSMAGVAGTMEEISQTLGGAMSNAADSTDTFFNAIGKRLEPGLVKLMGTYGRVIGRVSEWIELPTEKKLLNEKTKVNELAAVLSNTNIPIKERNVAYAKLKEIQPDIVEGINTESVDLGALTRNLAEYNEQAAQKIVLAGIEKEEGKIINKQNKLRADLIEAQTNALAKVNSALADMNKLGTQDERVTNLFKELTEAINEGNLEKVDEITDKMKGLSTTLKQETNTELSALGFQLERFADITFPGYSASLTNTSNALSGNIEKHGDEVEALKAKKEALLELIKVEEENNEDDNNKGGGSPKTKTKEDLLAEIKEEYELEVLALKQKRNQDLITEQEYKDQLLSQELIFLEEKKALLQLYGEDTISIEQEIADKEYEIKQKASEKEKKLLEKQKKEHQKYTNSITDMMNDYVAEQVDVMQKQQAEEEQSLQEKQKKYYELGQNIGTMFGEFAGDIILQNEELGKNLILNALDALQKIVWIAISKATINSIANYGPAVGALRAGISAGLITAAFTVAKRAVTQRAKGKYDVVGAQDGRSYSNIPYEGFVEDSQIFPRPTLISEYGGEMVLTAPHVQNIKVNHPEVLNGIMATRVPQRAIGNYPVPENTVTNTVENQVVSKTMIDNYNKNIEKNNELLSEAMEKGFRTFLVWSDLEAANKTMETIKNKARK